MINRKLIRFLKSMPRLELNKFERYIAANTNANAQKEQQLFKYLKKQHPDFPENKLAPEAVFKKTPFKEERQLGNTSDQLKKRLEKFWMEEEFQNNSIEQDFMLLAALKKHKLDDDFFKKITELEKKWAKQTDLGIEALHHLYRLKKQHFLHPNFSKPEDMLQAIPALIQQLEQYYFASKLYWTLCHINTTVFFDKKDKISEDSETNLIDNTFPTESIASFVQAKRQTITQAPQTQLLLEILDAINQNNFEHYKHIKANFLEQFDHYTLEEQRDLILFLSQICYNHYIQGNPSTLENMFELQDFTLEKGLMLSGEGYIPNDQFLDYFNIACGVGKLNWAEKFIEEYAQFIEAGDQEKTKLFCQARLFFEQTKYQKVSDLLKNTKIHFDLQYGVHIRVLKLKTYYELDDELDDDLDFEALIRSSKKYVNENSSISGNNKSALINFINFINTLYKYRIARKLREEKPENLHKLKEDINTCEVLAYKNWLLKKTNQL